MKIQGTTIKSDKEQSGVEVNFGRVLKFEIGNLVYEFSPLKKDSLTPRLEATINCRPQVGAGMKDMSVPGFTAKLTIYNPGTDLFNLLANNKRLPSQKTVGDTLQKNTQKVIKRPSVKVSAGYWDYENKTEKYTTIFNGFLNTSSYYRKGVDAVMELWCANVEMSYQSYANLIGTPVTGDERTRLQQILDNRKNLSDISYKAAIKTLIQNLAKKRQPKVNTGESPLLDTILNRTAKQENMSPIEDNSSVTDEERKSDEWIQLHPIAVPYIGPDNYPSDEILSGVMNTGISNEFTIYTGKPDDDTLKAQLTKLLKNFPGGEVAYAADYETKGEVFHWYFWYVKGEGGGVENTKSVPKTKTTVIEDFQNFIEAPVCNGNGQLVMKMMFNPDCRPQYSIMLLWDKYKTNTILNPLDKIQGGQVTTTAGYYGPLMQLGRYSMVVKALSGKDEGDIFNTEMTIISVVHDLSTTGSKWFSTVTTAGLDMSKVRL